MLLDSQLTTRLKVEGDCHGYAPMRLGILLVDVYVRVVSRYGVVDHTYVLLGLFYVRQDVLQGLQFLDGVGHLLQ